MTLQIYKIASVTVTASSGAASIDFTSIPSGYTDLLVKVSARIPTTGNYVNLAIRFNGDTGSNYSSRLLYGDGSSTGSANESAQTRGGWQYANGVGSTSNNFSNGYIYIPNYTGSAQKSFSADFVAENNATNCIIAVKAGLWTGTAAITSISLFNNLDSTNLVQNSTATLYGIL